MKLVQLVFVLNNINLSTLLVGKKTPGWDHFSLWAIQLIMDVLTELWLSQLGEAGAVVFSALPRKSRVLPPPGEWNGGEPSMGTSVDQEINPTGSFCLSKTAWNHRPAFRAISILQALWVVNPDLSLIHPVNYINPKAFIWLRSQLGKWQVMVWVRRTRVQFAPLEMEAPD